MALLYPIFSYFAINILPAISDKLYFKSSFGTDRSAYRITSLIHVPLQEYCTTPTASPSCIGAFRFS